MKPEDYITREEKYGAHSYHPLPVVLRRDEDMFVWDVKGKRYFDLLSSYSALSQGRCHPKTAKALMEQTEKLTFVSRAFHTNILGECMGFICESFGHDKLLPTNMGAGVVEMTLKLRRRWGHRQKGVAPERAKVVVCSGNFHRRTITIISMGTDPSSYANFSPHTPRFMKISYNHVDVLAETLKNPDVVGSLAEPIQGEAGIAVPNDGYLRTCYDPCHQHNVLFIVDEIQTSISRTGKLLTCDYGGTRPDVLILGKALFGGVNPVSAVLVDDEIMLMIASGEHGSTYGGNPSVAKVAIAALEVVCDEHLSEGIFKMGELFRSEIEKIDNPMTKKAWDKGLLNAAMAEPKGGKTAWDICLASKENGLMAEPTRDHITRFTSPLVTTEEQMMEAIGIIRDTFAKL